MTYPVIYNAMVSIVSAIHETYYPATEARLQEMLDDLNAEDISTYERDALTTVAHWHDIIPGERIPSRDDISVAANILVMWLRQRCPELDDPFSKVEGYYRLALCFIELCEKTGLEGESEDAVEVGDAAAFDPEAERFEVRIDSLVDPSWAERKGTLRELKETMREELKGRQFIITSRYNRGRRGLFRRWNGTNTVVKLYGTEKNVYLNMDTEIVVLHKDI